MNVLIKNIIMMRMRVWIIILNGYVMCAIMGAFRGTEHWPQGANLVFDVSLFVPSCTAERWGRRGRKETRTSKPNADASLAEPSESVGRARADRTSLQEVSVEVSEPNRAAA